MMQTAILIIVLIFLVPLLSRRAEIDKISNMVEGSKIRLLSDPHRLYRVGPQMKFSSHVSISEVGGGGKMDIPKDVFVQIISFS